MKNYGDINLQQNKLIDAVLPLNTSFPTNPKVGQLAFTNKILYICVEINVGLPVWVPLTQTLTSYTHYQNTDAITWNITHNLNTSNVQVQVFDTQNRVIIPQEIEITNRSTVKISVASASQGSVVILSGATEGVQPPVYAYEFIQTTPEDTWVITHGLGYYPSIRVFVGNQEVQPASITFDNLNQVTITFTSAQVGQAKLV